MQYIINIIKDNNEVINKLSKPKIQNDAFLNLKNLYYLKRPGRIGSNIQSDNENNPRGNKKINFMMKKFFNYILSNLKGK